MLKTNKKIPNLKSRLGIFYTVGFILTQESFTYLHEAHP